MGVYPRNHLVATPGVNVFLPLGGSRMRGAVPTRSFLATPIMPSFPTPPTVLVENIITVRIKKINKSYLLGYLQNNYVALLIIIMLMIAQFVAYNNFGKKKRKTIIIIFFFLHRYTITQYLTFSKNVLT